MKGLNTKSSGLINFLDYKKKSYKILYAIMMILLFIAIIITVFPPLWLLLSSFKSSTELYQVPFTLFPESFDLGKVKDIWTQLDFGQYYLNSVWVILGALVCAILFNGLLAYAISIIKPAGHKIVFGMVMASLMIPPILNMGPLFNNIVKLGFINRYEPLWLVYGANPFYFIMFKTYFDGLPKSLFEAAQLDGANKLQMFRSIILPLSKPIIMVISIFTINAAWSDFLFPFLVLFDDSKQTVMVKIYKLQSTMGSAMNFGPDKLLMVLALSMIPPILFFIIFQKQITSSVATTGIK
jgi:multiple sugar transport system permease protein